MMNMPYPAMSRIRLEAPGRQYNPNVKQISNGLLS